MSDLPADARIMEAATTFLRRYGPRRATVVAIAESAGMSHANVYRYFPSKAALIEEVTAAWLRPIESEVRVIAESPDPAPDKLERILAAIQRAYRDKLERDPQLFQILAEAAQIDAPVARKHRARLQGAVQRTIEEGFVQGNFRQVDMPRALALVFDVAHRFLHPAAIVMDARTTRTALNTRASRVTRLLLQELRAGRY
ncbi:MAG: TetR family transcriptional regulator [Hyphomicrobiales bacterium]|nr:TetR family transcriptional regulator [Rhodoblastus sp.]MCB9997711.1 TetR/AcrR family transcriptional regulator [Methylobacteriaceae bacterium]MCC2104551.1 TetR family transcriptional regulator [Hyphomicrobiales bacterium]HRY04586.1 TetR/AcrR family transcriptional regulator [Beijerinckiaceae bacterium]MCO5089040.1 TetR family transcriptional regulator [Methylobacteriaceae bacterium]